MCDKPIIAVCGSYGRTTAANMVGYCLRTDGRKVFVGGTSDEPFINFITDPQKDELDFVIVEASAIQLQSVEKFEPVMAIYPNLDERSAHKNFQTITDYMESALKVVKNLKPEQHLIVNFDSILRLLHPFMPFITEDLSSKLVILEGKDKSEFLVKSGFTQHQPSNNNTAEHIEEIINIISAIRVIRAENTPIKNETLHLILSADMNSELQSMVTQKESIIASIAKLDGIEFTNEIPDEAIEKAMIGYKIIIPLEGLIDPELELSRLTKELNKVENDIKIINSKLSNEQFVAKAPEAVIIKEKEKLASAVEKKSMVESSLLKLNS